MPTAAADDIIPVMRLGILLLASGALLAQEHTYSAADIEQGGRLYAQTCTACHGPDGDQVAGIDLGRLKLRHTYSDDEIAGVLRNGLPGTGMPPNNLSPEQAGMVVGYLHAQAADPARQTALAGDPARGRALFEGKGQCANCHRIHGAGGRLGPDLSEIGSSRRAAQLEKSILDPDAEIAANSRPFRVVMKDGATVNGKLLNEDTFTVQMLDTREQLRSFVKSDLREFDFVDKSPMPSAQGRLSAQEVSDVVSYLASLKAPPPPPGARSGRGGAR